MAARINGKHRCGHPTKYLSESNAARGMIDQWGTEDCFHCIRYARDMEAIAIAHELGLPDLIGSEKQVPWARTIREDARAQLCVYTETHTTALDLAASELILHWQDAGWWIDREQAGDVYPEKLIEWFRPIVTIALGYKGA